jgi:hypothetical protein
MRRSVLHTPLAVAIVAWTACKGSSTIDTVTELHLGVAKAAYVVPVVADTTPRATATFNTSTLAWTYNIEVAPPGTITSVALYQVAAGASLPANPTALLCNSAATCTGSGTATLVGTATGFAIHTSIHEYGTQLVFMTTAAPAASGGVMRGTMYCAPSGFTTGR